MGKTQEQTAAIPAGGAVTLVEGTTVVTTVTNAGQGTYALDPGTGVITFTPEAAYAGSPIPVTYQVTDAYGKSVRSTYAPNVIAAPTTTPPTSTPPTSTSPTTTVAPAPAAGSTSAAGSLPNTGSPVAELAQLALVMVLVGLALIAAGHYRRRPRLHGHR